MYGIACSVLLSQDSPKERHLDVLSISFLKPLEKNQINHFTFTQNWSNLSLISYYLSGALFLETRSAKKTDHCHGMVESGCYLINLSIDNNTIPSHLHQI